MKKSKKLQFHLRESGRGCDSSSSALYTIKQCHRDVMASALFHFFSVQEHALGEPMQMSIHEISSQSSSPHTDIDSGKFWNNFLALKYLIFYEKMPNMFTHDKNVLPAAFLRGIFSNIL